MILLFSLSSHLDIESKCKSRCQEIIKVVFIFFVFASKKIRVKVICTAIFMNESRSFVCFVCLWEASEVKKSLQIVFVVGFEFIDGNCNWQLD